MSHKILALILAVSLMLLDRGGDSFAQSENSMPHDDWGPVSAGTLTTWTAPLCGKGKFVIQPFYFYNRARGTFDADGRYGPLPDGDKKYQYQEQFFAQYGLTDRIEFDAQTVYQQNYFKQGGVKAHARGFGDSYLFLRYCALEEKSWLPQATGLFQLKMPTGKYEKADPGKLGADLMGAGSGGGSWDPGFGAILTKRLRPFIVHADVIFGFPRQARIDGVKTRHADYLNYDLGVEYFLPKGFNLAFEINGFLQDGSNVNYFAVAPGIGLSNENIQVLIAYSRVVAGVNTDANDSVAVTFVCAF